MGFNLSSFITLPEAALVINHLSVDIDANGVSLLQR
jgi:hypothetical protein